MKLKCPNCDSDLRLVKSYSGADWNCEKGEGSKYGWEVRLECISCPHSFPLGNIREEKDFSPTVLKPYID